MKEPLPEGLTSGPGSLLSLEVVKLFVLLCHVGLVTLSKAWTCTQNYIVKEFHKNSSFSHENIGNKKISSIPKET
jgi:hypothetical protein